ncbi:MAG: hypothetical protein RTU63_01270 [Candidatus Thorarchaeota archaeon]
MRIKKIRGQGRLDYIKADWVQKADLADLLQKKVKGAGFLSKKSNETFESFKVVYRPFRKIHLYLTRSSVDDTYGAESLIDENLFPLVQDSNHQMLLWRPKYNDCPRISSEDEYPSRIDVNTLQALVDDIMEKRWQAQEFDEEIKPKLKRMQLDPLSTIAFLLPRTPGGLRKEQAIIDDRKESHSFILATSLLTNCSPKDIITSADLGETVLVETIIGIYKSDDGSSRLLALETPCTKSFSDALKAGKALTRLCDLYGECREIVSNTPK